METELKKDILISGKEYTISQYELEKAIKFASGGVNISAFIWRNSF